MLHYMTKEPSRPSPGGNTPVLMLLHGYGSNESDLMGLAPYLDPRLLIVSARAPHPLDFGGYAWFPIEFSERGITLQYDQAKEALSLIQELVAEVKRRFEPGPVLLLGFSQGATMALSAALEEPEAFDGVAFLSGICVPEMIPAAVDGSMDRLPVLMTHGRHDMVVPIQQGRASRALMERLPLDLRYEEYDMGHEINQACLEDLRAWLQTGLGVAMGGGQIAE